MWTIAQSMKSVVWDTYKGFYKHLIFMDRSTWSTCATIIVYQTPPQKKTLPQKIGIRWMFIICNILILGCMQVHVMYKLSTFFCIFQLLLVIKINDKFIFYVRISTYTHIGPCINMFNTRKMLLHQFCRRKGKMYAS